MTYVAGSSWYELFSLYIVNGVLFERVFKTILITTL